MAVGTLAAFAVQAVWMVWILDRRVGGLHLAGSLPAVGKMVVATALMAAACWGVQQLPWWPRAEARWSWAAQVAGLIAVGGGVYVVACRVLGVTVMEQLLPRRFRRRT
ncbi:MAG TPA: polysaccharide biosynthesis C-terminal domain-containing protein, partial [Humisphaera sp.]